MIRQVSKLSHKVKQLNVTMTERWDAEEQEPRVSPGSQSTSFLECHLSYRGVGTGARPSQHTLCAPRGRSNKAYTGAFLIQGS